MFYSFSRRVVQACLAVFFRFETYGTEHEPSSGPLLVCCNHRSLWDPPIVGSFLQRKMHFMAKAELFNIPVLGSIFRSYGALPVTRGGLSMETMKTAIRTLKQGNALVIFPEGTRQRSNKLGSGKKGAASLALRSGAKILPVAVIGPYRLFRPMKFVCGEAFDAADFANLPSSEQLDALTVKIMSSIHSLIEQHGGYGDMK